MANLNFLIDSLKEKLSRDGKEDTDEEKYPDMNYLVGNTSGMDVSADIPSPLDQRIGRMAQIGGEIMEVQLANPATFKIDRPELMNVLNQLGLDIKLHADPNIGFTGAYATRGAQVQGYTVVHRYFKRYLEQLAGFKADKERRSEEQEGFDFDIGYVNIHASTEPIPGLEEQIASDVSVDPFGKPIKDVYAGEEDGKNIYRNKEFMENLFDYFLDELFDRKNMYSEFSRFSPKFKKEWNKSKERVADNVFKSETPILEKDISTKKKIRLVQNASRRDRGVETTFMEEAQEETLDSPIEFKVTIPQQEDEDMEINTEYESLADFMKALGNGVSINALDGFIYGLNNEPELPPETPPGVDLPPQIISDNTYELGSGEVADIEELLRNVLRSIWIGNETNNGGKTFSLSAKQEAVFSTLNDLNQQEFMDRADGSTVRNAAKSAFAGEDGYYEDTDRDHLGLFNEIIENSRVPIGREMDKESVMFFHVLPAWMQVAEKEYEGHEGFPSAKFIWDHVVGNGYDGYDGFKSNTEDDRDFQLDVIAAVGCSYIWGHFTQAEDNFEIEEEDYSTGEMFLEEDGDYTWSQWMNKFGLKVNFEAMYGDPGSLLRVWRPKDIAIVARAINMTAERYSSSWEEDYKGDIAKFTIDMEHTASFGVDPWPEMEKLIEQEKGLAEEGGYGVDEDKPLADIVKTYHLTKPGFESSQSHRHGPFARGDKTLYRWLYRMVESGFTRVGEDADPSVVMFEVGGEYAEEMFVIRVVLDMIRVGIEPKDLDPSRVPMDGEYENIKQQLIARFYGLDQSKFNREWAKIESHAFDPLEGLLEAEHFDHTWSGRAALENDMRPAEWNQEEFK